MNTSLFVSNIKCGGCAKSITNKLNSIDGISNADVNVEAGKVSFEAIDEVTLQTAKSTLNSMGYTEGDPSTLATAKSYVNCMIGRMSK